MEYYQIIRNIREDKDIKQYEFAKMINAKPKNYNLYENGHRSMPLDILNNAINILDISLDYVLGLNTRANYPDLGNINSKVLAKNFRIYRKILGYTQEEMAFNLNCTQQTLSEYERGRLKIPIETLKKFSLITNVSTDTLTGRTNKEIHLKMPI